MVDDILVKVDRASMLASLEMRAPFLDQRIIEFAFGRVPRSPQGHGAASQDPAPDARPPGCCRPPLNVTRKRGFSIPLKSWMRAFLGRIHAGHRAGRGAGAL